MISYHFTYPTACTDCRGAHWSDINRRCLCCSSRELRLNVGEELLVHSQRYKLCDLGEVQSRVLLGWHDACQRVHSLCKAGSRQACYRGLRVSQQTLQVGKFGRQCCDQRQNVDVHQVHQRVNAVRRDAVDAVFVAICLPIEAQEIRRVRFTLLPEAPYQLQLPFRVPLLQSQSRCRCCLNGKKENAIVGNLVVVTVQIRSWSFSVEVEVDVQLLHQVLCCHFGRQSPLRVGVQVVRAWVQKADAERTSGRTQQHSQQANEHTKMIHVYVGWRAHPCTTQQTHRHCVSRHILFAALTKDRPHWLPVLTKDRPPLTTGIVLVDNSFGRKVKELSTSYKLSSYH